MIPSVRILLQKSVLFSWHQIIDRCVLDWWRDLSLAYHHIQRPTVSSQGLGFVFCDAGGDMEQLGVVLEHRWRTEVNPRCDCGWHLAIEEQALVLLKGGPG